jgi:cell division inhibitor SepF
MATLWRKTMYHLGLAPEDEYDDFDVDDSRYGEPVDEPPRRAPQPRRAPVDQGAGRPMPRRGEQNPEPSAIGAVRPIRSPEAGDPGMPEERERPSRVVRPVPIAANAKPHALSPVSFDDAQELADKFKGSQPVIMNLQNADRDLARRLIDFASGLCYGVGGQMEKVANSVYLLTPSNVEVSAEERRRMQEHDFSGR